MAAVTSAQVKVWGLTSICVATMTTANPTLPASPRSSMHHGCCPTTDPPTTVDSIGMAQILGEVERREGAAALLGGLEEASHTAESSSVPFVQCGRSLVWAESSALRGLPNLLRCQTCPSLHSLAAGLAGPRNVSSSPNLTAPVLLGHRSTPRPALEAARTAAAKALHPPVGHD